MNQVLVSYASRMGSTAEIARVIGEQLRLHGFEVDVTPVDQARDALNYTAVILGSALYLGHWERDAVAYLKSQAPDLAERPTWLFQSGPVDPNADLQHAHVPRTVVQQCYGIGIEPPATFGGNLDRAKATERLARWVTDSNLNGDFRDWDRIRRWADEIAVELQTTRTLSSV